MKFEIQGKRRAFTLIEMMVVVAIIGIIASICVVAYGRVTRSSQQERGRALVTQTAIALEELLNREKSWPKVLVTEAQGQGLLTPEVAACLAVRNLMSLSYKTSEKDGETVYTLSGLDRCGIVTPWAMDALKRVSPGDSGYNAPVAGGGTVRDHQLHFALDLEGNGFVDAHLGSKTVRVRKPVVVWCWGRNGREDDYESSIKGHGKADDIYSWSRAQEVR